MKPAALSLGPHLQAFFTEHLTHHKRVSPQTLASVRDSFRLLLEFLRTSTGIEPAALQLTDLNAPAILAFLDHLEQNRANSVRSRNVRLSAIRTFFRYVGLRDPDRLGQVTQIMAIPVKRQDKTHHCADARRNGCSSGHSGSAYVDGTARSRAVANHVQHRSAHFGDDRIADTAGAVWCKDVYRAAWQRTKRANGTLVVTYGASTSKRGSRNCLKRWGIVAFPNARGHQMARDGVEYLLRQTVKKAASDVAVSPASGFCHTPFTRQLCICSRRALTSPSSHCG
jgi:integrase/recombinase XerD